MSHDIEYLCDLWIDEEILLSMVATYNVTYMERDLQFIDGYLEDWEDLGKEELLEEISRLQDILPDTGDTPQMANTVRQEKFIVNMAKVGLVSGYTQYQAAEDAGYSKNASRQQSSRLLTYVTIKEGIKQRRSEIFEDLRTDVLRTIVEIKRIAYLDERKLYLADGKTFKNIHDIDDDTAAAIQGIKVSTSTRGNAKIKELKVADKLRALEILGKIQGLFDEVPVDPLSDRGIRRMNIPFKKKEGDPVEV